MRQPGQARELRTEVLDHHFLVAEHLVDMERDPLFGAAHQHDRGRLAGEQAMWTRLQQRAQPEERQVFGPVAVAATQLLRRGGFRATKKAHGTQLALLAWAFGTFR